MQRLSISCLIDREESQDISPIMVIGGQCLVGCIFFNSLTCMGSDDMGPLNLEEASVTQPNPD
jgi:hypothetical protein